MTSAGPTTRTPLQLTRGVLIGALPSELTRATLVRLRHDLLQSRPNERLSGVVLDASAVEVMDSADYRSLCETARMCRVMGRPAVICGLNPGVVSSLVDFDVDAGDVVTMRNVESALDWLSAREM